MADLPSRARAIIIGGGIMGSALVHHLALQGWSDLVLVDQGPFPNTGGSTGHSSAMVWLPEASRVLTAASVDSVRQYKELGVHTTVGGLDLGRTPERIADYRRRIGFIRTWGDFQAALLSPAEIRALVPYLDDSVLLGGLYLPSTGVVDAIRAGTLMREAATAAGALQAFPLTEVLGIDVDQDRVTGIRTDRGAIRSDVVILCGGVWGPKLAAMAGASVPFTPGIQQLVSVGPIAAFANLPGEIDFPIIRDSDPRIYARRVGGDMEVGSAGHRPMLWDADRIPSLAEATLTPTELPFTADDFDASLESALELFPSLFDDERAGIRYAINGLSSMSADGLPIIGEQPEVRGLWSANRVDIKMAPAVARTLATWLVRGMPETALQPFDLARFLPHERETSYVKARATEMWTRMYERLHPARELSSARDQRHSPVHDRLVALGAQLGEQAGWEIPKWYAANEPLLDVYGSRVLPRSHEWDARWWSPIANAEHLALRDGAGIEDLSSQAMFEVTGPAAAAWLDGLSVSAIGGAEGAAGGAEGAAGGAAAGPRRAVRTWLLDPAGGVVDDVLVVRVEAARLLVLGSPASEARLAQWLTRHLPTDGTVSLHNATGAWAALGAWGGHARELVAAATGLDVGEPAFPRGGVWDAGLGGAAVLVVRTDRLGGPGWELLLRADDGVRAWDALVAAGGPLGGVPVGSIATATTVRLEAGLRSRSLDYVGGYGLVEAGVAGPVRESPFVGRDALLAQVAAGPAALLCTLGVDDQRGPDGEARFMQGGEPVTTRDDAILVDARGRRSFVTSAGSAPTLGRHLLTAYLPVEHARVGAPLAVQYFGMPYPVTVLAVGSDPVVEPSPRTRA